VRGAIIFPINGRRGGGGDMDKLDLTINCPRSLINNFKSYNFLQISDRVILQSDKCKVIWNMAHTKVFHTNLLAVFYYIFQKNMHKGKQIVIKLPNRDITYSSKALFEIFKYYSSDQRAFFKPRTIGDNNIRETEDILLKYLKRLKLADYESVKTIMSELFANIKMHTENHNGFMSADMVKQDNKIVLSIVNGDYSLPYQLELERKMIFESDRNAVLWALKKSNSTRKDNESGGLGLYLLRKYMHQMGGEIIICSGHCFLKLDGTCFDDKDDTKINVIESYYMNDSFEGTIITLFLPYMTDERKDEDHIVQEFNILDMLEEKNGLY